MLDKVLHLFVSKKFSEFAGENKTENKFLLEFKIIIL
jgi:hypothetical protein